MTELPRSERKTQNGVIARFADKDRPDCLGYRYFGEWHTREKTRALKQAMMQALSTGKTRPIPAISNA